MATISLQNRKKVRKKCQEFFEFNAPPVGKKTFQFKIDFGGGFDRKNSIFLPSLGIEPGKVPMLAHLEHLTILSFLSAANGA